MCDPPIVACQDGACQGPGAHKNNPGGRSWGGENERPARVSQGGGNRRIVAGTQWAANGLCLKESRPLTRITKRGSPAVSVQGGVFYWAGWSTLEGVRSCLVSVPALLHYSQ